MAAEEDLRHLMLQSCNAISFYSIPVLRVQGPISGSHLQLVHQVPASVRTLIANLLHKLPLSIFDDMMIHNIWRTELCSIHHRQYRCQNEGALLSFHHRSVPQDPEQIPRQ